MTETEKEGNQLSLHQQGAADALHQVLVGIREKVGQVETKGREQWTQAQVVGIVDGLLHARGIVHEVLLERGLFEREYEK